MEKITQAGYKDFNLVTFCWYLTNLCQYRCSYCAEHFRLSKERVPNEDLAYKSVLAILRLRKMSNFSVEMVGGEPTLHPRAIDILKLLSEIDKCKYIELHTNLKRSYEYFEQFNIDKLVVKSSFHPEYYTDEFVEKIIKLNKRIHIRPIAIMSDNSKYWSITKQFLDILIDNNIDYELQPLYEVAECNFFAPKYTDKFFEEFESYFARDELIEDNRVSELDFTDASRQIPYTVNGNTVTYTEKHIRQNALNKFKGFFCTPVYWSIEPTGEIINSCTGERLNVTLNNLNKRVTCPVSEGCRESQKLFYYKSKHE